MHHHPLALAITLALGNLAFTACGDGIDQSASTSVPASIESTTTVLATTLAPTTTTLTTTPATTTTVPARTTTTIAPATTTIAPATPTTTTPLPTTSVAPPSPTIPAGFTLVVPVGGPDGLTYTDELIEEARFGPSLISIDDLGGVHLSDPLADRIVTFRNGVRTNFDLSAVGATSPLDFIAADDRFILLEDGGGAPEVIVVSYSGELLDRIAVPEGFQLQDGLYGLIDTGDDARIVLEFLAGDPGTYVEWHADEQQWVPTNTLEFGAHVVTATAPSISIDGFVLPIDATPNNEFWASLRFAGLTNTGGVVALRWDGTSTVEWWSKDGTFLGAAMLPQFIDQTIEEAATEMTVTDDGRVFALTTGPDTVTVAEIVPGPDRILTR